MTIQECSRVMYESYATLRDKRGLNDASIARALGFDRSDFSDWKNGKSCPKINKIIDIADFFGVSVDFLLKRGKR